MSTRTHLRGPRSGSRARAREEGRLLPQRLENFYKLQRELRYLELRRDHSAQLAEKRRWKQPDLMAASKMSFWES